MSFDSNAGYMLKKPYSNRITKGPYKLKTKEQYEELITLATNSGYYVWYGQIVNNAVTQPHLIDFRSVPNDKPKITTEIPNLKSDYETIVLKEEQEQTLQCPTCGKICTSKSGYTLHQKRHQNA